MFMFSQLKNCLPRGLEFINLQDKMSLPYFHSHSQDPHYGSILIGCSKSCDIKMIETLICVLQLTCYNQIMISISPPQLHFFAA